MQTSPGSQLKLKLFSLLRDWGRGSSVLALATGVAVLSLGFADAASRATFQTVRLPVSQVVEALSQQISHRAPASVQRVSWEGADLDGDGQADVANPTGQAPRTEDAYGEGRFHASRDGGRRRHEGVDYVSTAGQEVTAPISGFVSKIGLAYPGDSTLHFVEIENPALQVSARVFYVDPSVAVGDAVALGHDIGRAHSLQRKYGGITDHVHLELADRRGRKLDAETLIQARLQLRDQLALN